MALKRSSISGSSGSSKYEGGSTANRPANPSVGQLYFDTDLGGLLIYNGASWSTFIAPAPVVTPISRQAIDNGANREYVAGANGSITVNFSRSELGGYPTSYTITASPGGATQTVTSPTATFTGLTAGQSYTFSIVANNAYGSSSPGTVSAMATTKPQPVSSITVTGSSTSDLGRLRVIAPSVSSGGKSLRYRAVLNTGQVIESESPEIQFTGLNPGTTYTATVSAINDNGETSTVSSSGIASRYICHAGGSLSGSTCTSTSQYNAVATVSYGSCTVYHSAAYRSGSECYRDALNRTTGKIVTIYLGLAPTTTTYSCPSGGTPQGSVCVITNTYQASIG